MHKTNAINLTVCHFSVFNGGQNFLRGFLAVAKNSVDLDIQQRLREV